MKRITRTPNTYVPLDASLSLRPSSAEPGKHLLQLRLNQEAPHHGELVGLFSIRPHRKSKREGPGAQPSLFRVGAEPPCKWKLRPNGHLEVVLDEGDELFKSIVAHMGQSEFLVRPVTGRLYWRTRRIHVLKPLPEAEPIQARGDEPYQLVSRQVEAAQEQPSLSYDSGFDTGHKLGFRLGFREGFDACKADSDRALRDALSVLKGELPVDLPALVDALRRSSIAKSQEDKNDTLSPVS